MNCEVCGLPITANQKAFKLGNRAWHILHLRDQLLANKKGPGFLKRLLNEGTYQNLTPDNIDDVHQFMHKARQRMDDVAMVEYNKDEI